MQEFCKEVCVDNIKDAMRAVDLGANRIEYCSKLSEEGLTPDIEDVKYLLKNINIPLRIMIRPHSKSFNYSEKDLIKNSNIDGALTSGGFKKAEDGVKLLKKMLDICPINFELIIAGKITSKNINKINQKLSAKFYHGKKIVGVL